MKPVYQDIRGHDGNCLAACIASILEIPLDGVPNFVLEREWRRAVNRFLEHFGLCMVCVRLEKGAEPPDAWMIVCGRTMEDRWHATVGRRGVVVFDPEPGGSTFIDDDREYELFVALDPASRTGRS